MKKNTFKLPNQLIMDQRLSFSSRHIGAIFYSRRNALGVCRKSLVQLSALSGYSKVTVLKAVKELEAFGYLKITYSHTFRKEIGCVCNDRNTYHLNLKFSKGYTLVPRTALEQPIKDSAMVMYLYLFVAAGNRNRAWPSIRKISKAIGAAASTVCRALQKLKCLQGFFVEHCRAKSGSFCANSYFVHVTRVKCALLKAISTPVSDTTGYGVESESIACSLDYYFTPNKPLIQDGKLLAKFYQ